MIFKKHGHHEGATGRVKLLAWLSIVGWSTLIVAMVVFHYARPEMEYGIYKFHGTNVRDYWVAELTLAYLLLVFGCIVISLVSLWVNHSRLEQQHRVRFNVVLLLLIAVAMLVHYFITA